MAAPVPSQAAATVEFDHVSKSYAARVDARGGNGSRSGVVPAAVQDLSLTVPAGRICVLVGPSGCGKTTSLKMVNRLIEPTSGRILLDGIDVATRDLTELRRSIGYVIQQTGLFPHQTVLENVVTVPRLLGWPPARQRARGEELLAMVGLEPIAYADRYPAQLSGGERQRVGVARALAADPPVMLMDEPFGAVDPIVRERLQNEFLRLQEQLAKTILFVTHDVDEAIKMGDLVAVFETGGVVAQVGTPVGHPRQAGLGLRRPVRGGGPRPQAPGAAPPRRHAHHAGPHRPRGRQRDSPATPRRRRPVAVPPRHGCGPPAAGLAAPRQDPSRNDRRR